MHDWKELVRVRLTPLPLEAARREEIIEELAQQLEEAYSEAIAGGASDSAALHRSLAQFKDWEDLRKAVFHAVEAEEFPVWQQSAILSPRRPAVWIALVLSIALLGLFGFRQALETVSIPFVMVSSNDRSLSARTLGRIERQAVAKGDSRTLAFVALHHPDINEAAGAAEKAIALDPRLTWISARFTQAEGPEFDPAPWIARLKTWDPENAFPYLLEAAAVLNKRSHGANGDRRDAVLESTRAIATAPDFLLSMQKAFAAPTYNSYASQRFELDRAVLGQQKWDRPSLLLLAVTSRPIPNLFAVRSYAKYLVETLGVTAEKAGRTEEAAVQYETAAQFGARMQQSSAGWSERLNGMLIRKTSYEHLLPLLRQQGRTGEAAIVESSQTDLQDALESTVREYHLGEASASRAAPLVLISDVLVIVLGVAALGWLGLVTLLFWKENAGGLLNHFASAASVAPPSLLVASLCLYGAYYPYARHIMQFQSENQLVRDLMPFWESLTDPWMVRGFWLTMLLWPAVWCVAIAVLGLITLRWMATRPQNAARHEE
jgi:hypothetical protein